MTINSEVRSYAERLAKLEEQLKEIGSDIYDLKIEARKKGYDAMLIGKVAKIMILENDKRQQKIQQADLFVDYLTQAGMR